MSVHDAAAWYSMFVCMAFDTVFPMLPMLAVLPGSILWILLVLRVLHSSVWCPKYGEYWRSMSSTSTEGPNTASAGR